MSQQKIITRSAGNIISIEKEHINNEGKIYKTLEISKIYTDKDTEETRFTKSFFIGDLPKIICLLNEHYKQNTLKFTPKVSVVEDKDESKTDEKEKKKNNDIDEIDINEVKINE